MEFELLLSPMKDAVIRPKFNIFMKKILALLVLGFALHFTVAAQPTVSFSTESGCTGQQVCMDVKVKDFTDILLMSFTMQWDPTLLQFQQVTAFGLPGMTNGNFNVANQAMGSIDFNMPLGSCPAGAGVTRPDGHVIFQICFNVLSASYGQVATVSIPASPVPVVYRTNVGNCTNIGLLKVPGIVSTCVQPISFIASTETGNAGDLVCVDFRVTGFEDMRSSQFSVRYDPAILEFQNIIAGDVPNLSVGSFGLPGQGAIQPGEITMSWSYFIPGEPPVTLADSSIFFTACFRIIGPCESSSVIRFDSIPTPIEFTNDNNVAPGFNIYFQPVNGRVTAGSCAPTGLQLNADCGMPVNLNDHVCVKVTVGNNFTNISDAAFLMKWNSSILEFTNVQSLAALPGLNMPDFNTSNAGNGVLGFDWSSVGPPSASLTNGTVLFEVCFDVIGLGGNSPFSFSLPANVQINNGANIGINPSNCEVEVNQPAGVVMTIGDGSAPPGDQVCLDVTVSNFEDITHYQFSTAWDPTHMEFESVQNITLPQATISNFSLTGVMGGSLFFDWTPSTGQTLPDQTVIFQLCFTPVGPPQQCDVLEVVGLPLVAQATNSMSNGEDIGVTDTPGEVCILFPEGFGLTIDTITGDLRDTVCVGVSVESFDNITAANFDITWDPAQLQFIEVNPTGAWPGLSGTNFNVSGTPVGLITLDWANPAGAMIPDGTVVFELCYELIGEPRECHPVEVNDSNTPEVTTLNGTGSMLYENGEICINDKIFVDSVHITPVSCPGACDGSIIVYTSGGLMPIGSAWQSSPPQFAADTIRARNLCVGPIVVTLFDAANPATIRVDTFDIPLTTNLPMANAGPDKELGCNPNSVLVSGTGSQGANFSYQWTNITTGQTYNSANFVAMSPGPYCWGVTNITTQCIIKDTMMVTQPVMPTAAAGTDLGFTCLSDTISLDGSLSTAGPNIQYTWAALTGGNVVSGDQNLVDPRINGPGTYELTVRITLNNCTDKDTVVVADERMFPGANGGPDLSLGCTGNAVTLDASPSDNQGLDVSYEWFDPSGASISTDITAQANQLGQYIVAVTDNASQCIKRDTVFLIPSTDYPQITLEDSAAITCLVDTVTLLAAIAPDTIMYTLQWNALDGGNLVPGTEGTLTPMTNVEGLYELVITNTENSCVSRDTVQVLLDNEDPTADAGADNFLTCASTAVTLDGSGSDQGDGYMYFWTNGAGDTISTAITAEVTSPGTYTLEVLSSGGCSATDAVIIGQSGAPPILSFDEPDMITCINDTVYVTVNPTPVSGNYMIQWQAIGTGNIAGPANTATIPVDAGGDYQVTVTEMNFGCSTIDTVTVLVDTIAPTALIAEAADITCDASSASLDGNGSSTGMEIAYEWTNIVGGELPFPNDQITAEVGAGGTYQLRVTNMTNGCEALATVEVSADTVAPTISVVAPSAITCLVTSATLDASASSPSTNIIVQWSPLNGGAISPTDNLIATATAPGDYEIFILNSQNGCKQRDTVTVAANNTPPNIQFNGTPANFSCTGAPVSIDASPTGNVADFSSITWQTIDGGTITPASGAFVVQVNAAGSYIISVVNAATGCTAMDTIAVNAASDTPVADAGEDQNIECGETAMLGGPNTSQGPTFNYLWQVVSGAALTGSNTTSTVTAEGEGTYQLIVTNTTNNCKDTSIVVAITVNTPPDADAGQDMTLCAESADLRGNTPTGTTGMWTSLSGALIDAPDQASTTASNLAQGENLFMWVLSAPGCPEYSADTVTVNTGAAPTAVDDQLEIGANARDGSVNLISNDVLGAINDWSLSVLTPPAFGRDTVENGVLNYSVSRGASGTTTLVYQICDNACPNRCDSATVFITVIDDGVEVGRPNTITPNDDGLNESLFFDEIQNNPPDMFPDNELIVFNRWGDIVFQAKPYNNDWKGNNSSGQPLPHGTYYYILRLDISEGIIIRGDVTIVK